jgi:hypothetical protein
MLGIAFSKLRGQSNQSRAIVDGADRGATRGSKTLRDDLGRELKKVALEDRELEVRDHALKALKSSQAAQFEGDLILLKKASDSQITELHADDFVPLLG